MRPATKQATSLLVVFVLLALLCVNTVAIGENNDVSANKPESKSALRRSISTRPQEHYQHLEFPDGVQFAGQKLNKKQLEEDVMTAKGGYFQKSYDQRVAETINCWATKSTLIVDVKEPPEVFKMRGESFGKPPVVLIPGIMSSALNVRIKGDTDLPAKCVKFFDAVKRTRAWLKAPLSRLNLDPNYLDCMTLVLQLDHHPRGGRFANRWKGVSVEVEKGNFGLSGLDFLFEEGDFSGSLIGIRSWTYSKLRAKSAIFGIMIEKMINQGYIPGRDLFGAPYDWRFLPSQDDYAYFKSLKKLIEKAYRIQETPVSVVAHSMGNLFFQQFLKFSWCKEPGFDAVMWKKKYIGVYVSVAAPLQGAYKAAFMLNTGDSQSLVWQQRSMSLLGRTVPTTYWLLPNKKLQEPLITLVNTKKELSFEESVTTPVLQPFQAAREAAARLPEVKEPPGVTMYCVSGLNLPTPHKFYYKSLESLVAGREPIKTCTIDGDGTVSTESIRLCRDWQVKSRSDASYNGGNNIDYKELDGKVVGEHGDILKSPEFIDDVISYIFKHFGISKPEPIIVDDESNDWPV